MTNVLVAVDGTESTAHVLEAAIGHAESGGGSLVALHAMPPRVFEARRRALTGGKDLRYDGVTYTASRARSDARDLADRAATEALGTRDLEYVPVGAVGKLVPTVLATAAQHDCGVVVLPEDRSWWRRRAGLADRRIARRFDGTVVRVPRPYPPNLETDRSLPETDPETP